MERFYKAKQSEGYQEIFGENGGLLKYLAFGKLTLQAGSSYSAHSADYEIALVVLTGSASMTCEGQSWAGLGGRSRVFDGKATAVYVPCRSEYTVTAESALEVAVCKVRAEQKLAPFVVLPEQVKVNQRGKNLWSREVHDIMTHDAGGDAQRIILGETFNEPGQWSSFPPHKHDGEHYPEEPNFEEIYYYQVNPAQGFGVQLHYTKDGAIDDAYTIRNGDSFAIDRGYHPVSAAGGYRIYYLWFMAGESGRVLKPYEDPDHRWLHKLN